MCDGTPFPGLRSGVTRFLVSGLLLAFAAGTADADGTSADGPRLLVNTDPGTGLFLAYAEELPAELHGTALVLRFGVTPGFSDQPFECGDLPFERTLEVSEDGLLAHAEEIGTGPWDRRAFEPDQAGDAKVPPEILEELDRGPLLTRACLVAERAGIAESVASAVTLPVAFGGLGLPGTLVDPSAIGRRLRTLQGSRLDDANDINAYGRICEQSIGIVPPFSCFDTDRTVTYRGRTFRIQAEEIPITVGGRIPTDAEFQRGIACDRPALLGTGYDCAPHSRIGTITDLADPDVELTFICRRYATRTASDPIFKDTAVIHRHRKSGATCWYQKLANTSSARVPPPAEEELPSGTATGARKASDFWLTPRSTAGIGCYRCHDNDPWMHSPYVLQARKSGPPIYRHGEPYHSIGTAFAPWPRLHTFKIAGNSCTQCHGVGQYNTCASWIRHASGNEWKPLHSQSARRYPGSHWMPIKGNRQPDLPATGAEWTRLYDKDYEAVKKCCQGDLSVPGCRKTPIPGLTRNFPPMANIAVSEVIRIGGPRPPAAVRFQAVGEAFDVDGDPLTRRWRASGRGSVNVTAPAAETTEVVASGPSLFSLPSCYPSSTVRFASVRLELTVDDGRGGKARDVETVRLIWERGGGGLLEPAPCLEDVRTTFRPIYSTRFCGRGGFPPCVALEAAREWTGGGFFLDPGLRRRLSETVRDTPTDSVWVPDGLKELALGELFRPQPGAEDLGPRLALAVLERAVLRAGEESLESLALETAVPGEPRALGLGWSVTIHGPPVEGSATLRLVDAPPELAGLPTVAPAVAFAGLPAEVDVLLTYESVEPAGELRLVGVAPGGVVEELTVDSDPAAGRVVGRWHAGLWAVAVVGDLPDPR